MFTQGAILFFDPFHFKNSNPAKAKYFIVLAVTPTNTVLATLPSSKDFVPAGQTIEHGCVEIEAANFNCYIFPAGQPVATNGWAFPRNTFVYGQQLDEYDVADMQSRYPVEGLDYEIVGQLTSAEFGRLRTCLAASASVKRKFRKML